jgi:phosphate transport system permease protein
MVWLTAMGLTIGLMMVVYLIGLIVVNGLTAFWPTRVAQIEIKEGSKVGINHTPRLGGKIVKVQQKATQGEGTRDRREWQVMVGNKEVYGFGFTYLDYADIANVSYPADVMLIERLEYGDAIGLPVTLQIKGEGTLPATSAAFTGRLQTLVTEVNQRREAIKAIEQKDIGRINAHMDALRLQQRALERAQLAGTSVSATQLQPLQNTMAALQAEYELLARRAGELRNQQREHTLTYRLITGEERHLALGQIVHVSFPNQLSVWQRLGLFLHHVWVFLSEEPREANTEGGVFPAIFGTFVMTLLMSLAVTPFGVLAALYLRE